MDTQEDEYVWETSCSTPGCEVEISVFWVTGGALNIQVRGDFGGEGEYADIYLNSEMPVKCDPTGSDCDENFDCGTFDVLPNTNVHLIINSYIQVDLCSPQMVARVTFSRNYFFETWLSNEVLQKTSP